jgi:hypothetical protein
VTKKYEASMRLFHLKCRKNLSDTAFQELCAELAAVGTQIDSLGVTERNLARILGLSTVKFDRCITNCMLFVGEEDCLRRRCRYCKIPRFIEDGDAVEEEYFADEMDMAALTPKAFFEYIPLIRRLQLLFANPKYAEKLRYPQSLQNDPWDAGIRDIWEGEMMKEFRENGINLLDWV